MFHGVRPITIWILFSGKMLFLPMNAESRSLRLIVGMSEDQMDIGLTQNIQSREYVMSHLMKATINMIYNFHIKIFMEITFVYHRFICYT